MELWIPITIIAAFMQNLRSALQKHLRGSLGLLGATYVRFLYAAPLAVGYAAGLVVTLDRPLPKPGPSFWTHALIGGLSQVVATALLIQVFSQRNFAVGTAYSKTETLQVALFSVVILFEPIGTTALLAILVSLAGVITLSLAGTENFWRGLLLGMKQPSAVLGILSGSFFAVSAVSYRAAALSLAEESVLMAAGFTLAVVTVLQAAAMGLWLAWRRGKELRRVFAAWRVACWVGLAGMLASACWFTAMTLEHAAHVRALGQIELVFTFVAGRFFFRERALFSEIAGVVLVIAGILILLLAEGT